MAYTFIKLNSQLVRKLELSMKIIITLLFVGLLLGSCSTQSYLTQQNYNTQNNKSGLFAAKTALERPMITPDELREEIFTNHAKTAEELEKNIFVSSLESSFSNILTEAKTFLGTPYRYGGTTRNGIDCSAFMQQIYEVEGIELPRVSSRQAKVGMPVNKSELQKGDLIFFSTTSKYRITHVAMVMEVKENEVKFIHSGSSKGVSVESLNHPYWSARYRTARRPEKFAQPMMVKMADLDSVQEIASRYP